MASDDQRRIIGKIVYAEALHVTALTECARKYGSRSKSKDVAGTVIECIGKKTKNNWSSTYVKVVYVLGGETLKTGELNNRSVLKAPNDTQDFVPDILQDPGEPLGLPLPTIPLLEGTDNKDDNSMFDLRQTISIPDTIDMINVLEVATVAVPKAAPDVSPEAAVLKVSAATVEDSGTNRDTSQETDTLGTPMVVVHDTKWYKEDCCH